MKEVKAQTFKDKTFQVIKGGTHPEYSFYTFEKEEKDFREKYWNVKADDIVFDVGASYGAYALSAAAMGAVVYAFEPEKTVYYDLLNNILINNWDDVCFPERIALWNNSDGLIDMREYAPHWPPQTITGKYKIKTLDQISDYHQLQKLDWLKIDVEGAEENVILGGLKTIEKFKPNVIIECHVFMNQDILENVKKLLLSVAQYQFEEVNRHPCIMLCGKCDN